MDFASARTTPFKKGSLLFAPMEGVTDTPFRRSIEELFPEWDYLSTDFLRLPSSGKFSKKKYIDHIGEEVLANPKVLKKTSFQVLLNSKVNIKESIRPIEKIGIKHLDINLGCPSPKVNLHKGGAYLLSELETLEKIICEIRQHYSHYLSAKIRIGYKDTKNFEDIIQTLHQAGVDSIIIHGRTREQLYKGKADWGFISKAVEQSSLPIIGNGDIFSIEDIEERFKTGCHSLMVARGALATPWLATLYKESTQTNPAVLDEIRKNFMGDLFTSLEKNYRLYDKTDLFILGRFKHLTRYLFDESNNKNNIRGDLLRAQDLHSYMKIINQL